MKIMDNLRGSAPDLARFQRDLDHAYSLLLSATRGNAALASELLFEPVPKLNNRSPSELIRSGNTDVAIKYMFEKFMEERERARPVRPQKTAFE